MHAGSCGRSKRHADPLRRIGDQVSRSGSFHIHALRGLLLAGMLVVLSGDLFSARLFAQQPESDRQRISMSVTSSRISIGEPFTLEVIVEGANDSDRPELTLPPEFRVTVLRPSTQSSTYESWTDGQRRSETRRWTAYRYELIARTTGTFTIPGAKLRIGEREVFADPVTVRVLEPSPDPLLTVTVEADHSVAYAGQPVLVTLTMFFTQGNVTDLRITAPDDLDRVTSVAAEEIRQSGSTLQFLGEATPYEAFEGTVDGRRGIVVRAERYIVPSRSGELEIGPISVFARVGGSVFSRGQSVIAMSGPLSLDVIPLPRSGRPGNFTGLVGDLDIAAEISPTTANVGDPMTLRVTINTPLPQRIRVEDLQIAQVLGDDFRLAGDSPRISYARDAAIIETSFRPLHASVTEFPSISLAHFDPRAGAYRDARSRPVPLSIREVREIGLADAVSAGRATSRDGADRYTGSGALAPSIPTLGTARTELPNPIAVFATPLLLVFLVAPPAAYLAVAGWTLKKNASASPAGRRRRIFANSRRRIARSSDVAEIGEALATAITAATGSDTAGLTPSEAESALLGAGTDAEVAERARAILARCDTARYAGADLASEAENLRRDSLAVLETCAYLLRRAEQTVNASRVKKP